MTTGDRFYDLLLHLYPRDFRASYGRAMRDFHRDRVTAAHADGESLLALWMLTVLDVVSSAFAEHLRPLLSGESVLDTLLQDVGYTILVGRVIRAMLVGVSTVDAPSLVGTTLALVAVAAVASLIPAIRALRVNPLEALRTE